MVNIGHSDLQYMDKKIIYHKLYIHKVYIECFKIKMLYNHLGCLFVYKYIKNSNITK